MKPSSRVIEILRGLQMENNSDIEIDFLRFHSVLQYLDEQAQEPKALEECKHVNLRTLCGGTEKYCSNCNVYLGPVAKPQEEPKECPECHYPKGEPHSRRCSMRRDGVVGETEPKEESERDMDLARCKNKECIGYKKGYTDGALVEKEQNALRNSAAIILPRPKGWRIGQTIWNFKEWLRLTHEVDDFFYMDDQKWQKRWSEYQSIKSQE